MEAHKHNIGEYANTDGTVSRERIISQLVARDSALSDRRARAALILSAVSIVVDIVQVALKYEADAASFSGT